MRSTASSGTSSTSTAFVVIGGYSTGVHVEQRRRTRKDAWAAGHHAARSGDSNPLRRPTEHPERQERHPGVLVSLLRQRVTCWVGAAEGRLARHVRHRKRRRGGREILLGHPQRGVIRGGPGARALGPRDQA